ncbi:hypothetical protein [Paracoccus sulfuroxidans]|uniref:hypothetical protein n=1 Tax=Paracoccus sulfuroxidans TaxID=384678 RepID=UPI0011A775A1|nr:hypothetical protein [Paracoccus sulfuroxidans]
MKPGISCPIGMIARRQATHWPHPGDLAPFPLFSVRCGHVIYPVRDLVRVTPEAAAITMRCPCRNILAMTYR